MMHTGEILPYRNFMNVTNVTSLLSMFFCENYWKQNLYKWNLMNVANVFDKVFPQCASWYVKLYIRTWFSPVWVMMCKATLLWFIYIYNVNSPVCIMRYISVYRKIFVTFTKNTQKSWIKDLPRWLHLIRFFPSVHHDM